MFSKRLSVPVQVDFLKQLKFLLSLDGMVLNKALTKIADSEAGSLSVEAEHIIDEIENVSSDPSSGKDCSDIRKGYYRSRVKSHFIFYRINLKNKEIEIMRILHQQMDIATRLNDLY